MHGLVAVAMEQDKYRAHAVPDSFVAGGDSTSSDGRPRNSGANTHASTNGLLNGTLSHSNAGSSNEASSVRSHASHAPLRSTFSREENEDELTDADSTDGEKNNMETRPCPKYRSCRERMRGDAFDLDAPSSSGVSVRHAAGAEEETRSGEARRSRKRAADCRTGRSNLDAEASSSDTSNDDYSLGSEDGCIYTYRGGEHLADLPSSFFSLDMGLPRDRHLPAPPPYAPRPAPDPPGEERRGSRASSPDMDYLEMDFDPGPSCEADSGEEMSPPEDLDPTPPPDVPERAVVRAPTPDAGPVVRESAAEQMQVELVAEVAPERPVREHVAEWGIVDACQPSTSSAGSSVQASEPAPTVVMACVRAGTLVTHISPRGERLLVRRTCRRWSPRAPVSHHINSGDLVCEREGMCAAGAEVVVPTADKVNLCSAFYHCIMAKKLMVEKPNNTFMEGADTSNLAEWEAETEAEGREEDVREVPRSMIWSEREACERQITQIATSACGATAVINVFLALGVPIDRDKIYKAVGTRQRANNAPIPRYLLSRAVAGCTAAGLVAGLQQASGGLVAARFFPTYPERVVSLSHWLADWISLGAVPILTLNLQVGCEDEGAGEASDVPDAWHHQMVFGVSPRGVFLTNPVECVPESQLWPQLCSDSVLLVRSRDVLSRLSPSTDLTPLMAVPDPRWASLNVLGQVVHVLRQLRGYSGAGCVRIPCAYRAGVTLAARVGTEAHRHLLRAPHLPLYAPPHPA